MVKSSVVQSSFFGQLPGAAWQAALSSVFPDPCHSLSFSPSGAAAVLGFGGASRFARASAVAAFLQAAGLACVVSSLGGGLSVFVGPTPAAVVSAFPWLVARG